MRSPVITKSTGSRGRVKDSICATSGPSSNRRTHAREERLSGARLRLLGLRGNGSAGASAR